MCSKEKCIGILASKIWGANELVETKIIASQMLLLTQMPEPNKSNDKK